MPSYVAALLGKFVLVFAGSGTLRIDGGVLAAFVYKSFGVPESSARDAEQSLPAEQEQRLKAKSTSVETSFGFEIPRTPQHIGRHTRWKLSPW